MFFLELVLMFKKRWNILINIEGNAIVVLIEFVENSFATMNYAL